VSFSTLEPGGGRRLQHFTGHLGNASSAWTPRRDAHPPPPRPRPTRHAWRWFTATRGRGWFSLLPQRTASCLHPPPAWEDRHATTCRQAEEWTAPPLPHAPALVTPFWTGALREHWPHYLGRRRRRKGYGQYHRLISGFVAIGPAYTSGGNWEEEEEEGVSDLHHAYSASTS